MSDLLPLYLLAITININPNLAQLGPFTLSWHGLFSAIGVIVGVTLGVRIAAEAGAEEDGAYNLALWSVGGGIVGARLFHVIDSWPYYSQHLEQIVLINEGGIAIYGAVIGGIVTGAIYARLRRIKLGAVADGGAVGLIIGQAIGRIGDVINGEHHGLPLDAPWAVVYTHPDTLGEIGLPVHLAVGYELIWDLLVFALLMLMRRTAGQGKMFWAYIFLYALGRFWISFYRVDAIQAFGLRQAQLIALVGIVAGAVMLFYLYFVRPTPPAASAEPAEDIDEVDEDESVPRPA
ncbi:MAG TPA: prolipoprotein diacylglyceryl transferase [Chloroflexota bacterium]